MLKRRGEEFWILTTLILYCFVHALTIVFWPRPSNEFVPILFKPLEDPELYLFFFNKTIVGQVFYFFLRPIFGYYYGDVLVFLFWIISYSLAGILFYLFVSKKLKESSQTHYLLILAAVGFVFFSRKFFNLVFVLPLQMDQLNASGLLEFARSLYHPYSNSFNRFFQPGFALIAFLCGLVCLEKIKAHSTNFRKLRVPIVLMVVAIFALPTYPWLGVIFFIYLFFETLWARKSKRLALLLIGLMALQTFALLLKGHGNLNADFIERVGIHQASWPDVRLLRNAFLFIMISLPFAFWDRTRRLGKSLVQLQVCIFLSFFTICIRGYTVEEDHFLLGSIVTGPILCLCFALTFLQKRKISFKVFALALGVLFALGLREQLIWKHSEYFFVPKSLVTEVERVQAECGPGKQKKYFFSLQPALLWAVPARTLCLSIIPLGRDDWQMSNSQIAARFMAASIYFKHFKDKNAFLKDLEKHLEHVGDPNRLHEFTRSFVKYDDTSRYYTHLLWYMFLSGYVMDPAKAPYLRHLFRETDFQKELNQIAELDKKGLILQL